MITLNAVVFFSLIFVVFVSFQLSHHINGFRLFIYIVGYLLIHIFRLLSAIHIVFLSFQIKSVNQQPSSLAGIAPEVVQLLLGLTAVSGLIVGVLYAINFLKYRLGYLSVGALLIVLILIQTLTAGRVVRDAVAWTPSSQGMPLATISATNIKHYGSPSSANG
jgi:hypothetical protein